ncbi:MAG: hypothetical protein HUJ80_04420, partial [Firmicutes bacterium]|nr:hypothetical protein [Bacillota bacterium]
REDCDLLVTDGEGPFENDSPTVLVLKQLLSLEDMLLQIEERRLALGFPASLRLKKNAAASCRFTLVTAAAGGLGLSTCSILLGRCLAILKEQRILYLSLDPLTGSSETGQDDLKDPDQTGQPPVLETLVCRALGSFGEQEQLRFAELLRAGLRKDGRGLYVLPQPDGFAPLHPLTPEELVKFLSLVAESGMADHVILDVPAGCRSLLPIAPLCEDVVLLEREDRPAKGAEAFRQALGSAAPGFLTLTVSADEWETEPDLYGQLGWEVMEFAKTL